MKRKNLKFGMDTQDGHVGYRVFNLEANVRRKGHQQLWPYRR
uniref:Uncharacterized protein n=1 Tax=Rhizophora mucronata TaxID=61149 RepID=A0A2P2R4N7_RHIMU